MKIPTYQKQVPYRGAYARDVQLATPLKESSGNKLWTDLDSAGGILSGLYEAPHAANRLGDSYEIAKDNWAGALDELKARFLIGNRAVYKNKYPDKAPKLSKNPPKKEKRLLGVGGGFSSPVRAQLLDFARQKAFGQTFQEQAASSAPLSGVSPSGPVERLDEYFGQTAQQLSAAPDYDPQTDLLTQDYAVLRREVQELNNKSGREAAQARFNQGAGSFVQTAALVRSPRALEEYIRANLDAAQDEALQNGMDASVWKGRKETLQAQAVLHNVEAALEAGEAGQAEAVYEHFDKILPEREKELLKSKLLCRKADLESEKLYPRADKECLDENGEINEKKLAAFVRNSSEVKEADAQKELRQALRARLSAGRRRELGREGQTYERLLSAGAAGAEDASALMGAYCRTEKDFERNAQVLRALQAGPQKISVHGVFNRLHENVALGRAERTEIENAFDKGELSAADYLRLKSRLCAAGAGRTDPRERLLGKAVQKLCRSCGLEGEEAEEVKYFVYSSGSGVEERLEAAARARRILNLQESDK